MYTSYLKYEQQHVGLYKGNDYSVDHRGRIVGLKLWECLFRVCCEQVVKEVTV